MASGRPDVRWLAKARAPIAFCLAGAAAGAALYFGNLAYVSTTASTAVPAPTSVSLPTIPEETQAGLPASNIVILADESGSIAESPAAIQGERQAASEIVQAEWSPQSQIAIYGFGSAPPGEPAAGAVQQYCGLTELTSSAARAGLANCAADIFPRSQGQGYNTDFAAAMKQAEETLSGSDAQDSAPIVFILTDGQLDVGQPNPYASTAAAGDTTAQAELTGVILPQLKSLGAQVWPVGFGFAAPRELAQFAHGGAQVNPQCPARASTPQPAIVPPGVTGLAEAEDIQQELLASFAAARCAAAELQPWRTLEPGQSIAYPVAINPLATFGSFTVNKGAPGVRVTYSDPGGHAVTDSTTSPAGHIGSADYILTTGGPQSSQESLRLSGLQPGTWQVTLTNQTTVPQAVGVSVVWQGQVQPDIAFSPQVGASGQPVRISVKPAVDSTPLPPIDLARLAVSLAVQWTPASAVQQVPTALDSATGTFTGTTIVPSGASGNASITATIQADGVQGTAESTLPLNPGGGLSVSLDIPPGTTVLPGGSVSAQAQVNNQGQPPTDIMFSLGDLASGVDASITAPAGPVQVSPGQMSVPVTIRIAPSTRLGPVLGTIRWAIAGQGTITPADWFPAGYVDVTVENPAKAFWSLWWFWLAPGALAAAAGSLALARRRYLIKKRT
jgi:hypothetical protein